MSLAVSRGTKKPWSWKLVGLLQIGNAVAFAAVAATVDFSREASGEQIVAVASETGEQPAESTASPAPDAALTDAVKATVQEAPMPTFAIEPTSPAAEPTLPATEPTTPADPPIHADSPPSETVAPSPPPHVEPILAVPVLVNPASNSLTVRCIVNGELVELAPGERRTLAGGDAWVVRYHRGGDFGAALEPIYEGTHRFVVGPQGWALERTDDGP